MIGATAGADDADPGRVTSPEPRPSGRSSMSLQELTIGLAAVMLALLAVTRVLRARRGRAAHPEGRARLPFLLAFLLVPPIALEVVTDPKAKQGQLHGIETVLVYLGALAFFSILMGIAALIVRLVLHGRARPDPPARAGRQRGRGQCPVRGCAHAGSRLGPRAGRRHERGLPARARLRDPDRRPGLPGRLGRARRGHPGTRGPDRG